MTEKADGTAPTPTPATDAPMLAASPAPGPTGLSLLCVCDEWGSTTDRVVMEVLRYSMAGVLPLPEPQRGDLSPEQVVAWVEARRPSCAVVVVLPEAPVEGPDRPWRVGPKSLAAARACAALGVEYLVLAPFGRYDAMTGHAQAVLDQLAGALGHHAAHQRSQEMTERLWCPRPGSPTLELDGDQCPLEHDDVSVPVSRLTHSFDRLCLWVCEQVVRVAASSDPRLASAQEVPK